jgi:hypothetical protein
VLTVVAVTMVAVVRRPAAAISAIFLRICFHLIVKEIGVCLFQKKVFTTVSYAFSYHLANTVTPPFTFWFRATCTSASTGRKRSTRDPNLMKPISAPCSTCMPGFR